MVKIDGCWDDRRSQLLDQAAPILEDLDGVLDFFEDPEAGYFGTKSMYVRFFSRGLTLEQPTIETLLSAAKKNSAVLSIDTREGPLVVTIMKPDGAF